MAQLNEPNDGQAAMGLEVKQLRTDLAASTTALEEIRQKNEAMTTEHFRVKDEFSRVQGLYESANTDNTKLTERVDELSLENQRFATELSEYANSKESNAITELPPVEVAEAPTARTSLVAPQGSDTAELERKNRQLLGLNEKAIQENKLLNRRIAELEGNVNELSITDDDRAVATSTVASSLDTGLYDLAGSATASTGKYNILRWLIPFLGIGLFIGLYVFLTEEYSGTTRTLVTDGNRGDDRQRKPRK